MAVSFWNKVKNLFLVDVEKTSPENPSTSLSKPDEWLFDALANQAQSGVSVTVKSTMGIPAMWRALAILGETIGSLPKEVIEKQENGNIETLLDHPVYPIIDIEPSPLYTSFDFFETLIVHACLFGNAYALIERKGVTANLSRLTLLDPREIRVKKDGADIVYIKESENSKIYRHSEIVHIKSLSVDGVVGMGIIDTQKENLGLSMANRDFLSNYYGKGAHLDLVLKHPDRLGDIAYNRVRNSWDARHSGIGGKRTAILEEGMDIKEISNSPKDAMSLDAFRISIEDVSRITGVPPHMLQSLDRATNNNIEHQGLEFGQYTIRPWVKRIEQELNRKLFFESEKGRIKARINMDALLRGDTKTRAALYASAIQNGWMNRNEVRRKEKMNSVAGLDEFFAPQNMASVQEDGTIVPNNQPDNTSEPQNMEQ